MSVDDLSREFTKLGPARSRFDDYVGTAAADDAAALMHTTSLYEIADLDRDRWTIVGIDFLRWSDSPRVSVYAVDRSALDPEAAADQQPLDELVVTAFHLTGEEQVEAFMRTAFQHFSVRLVARELSERQLIVAEHATLGAAKP